MNISKSMLNMSCTIYEVTGKDADRNPTYSEAQTLSNIWITYALGTTDGANGKEAADTMTLYYDVVVSLPRNFTFKQGMKVLFNNAQLFVEIVKPCYGLKGLEHYEVTLK